MNLQLKYILTTMRMKLIILFTTTYVTAFYKQLLLNAIWLNLAYSHFGLQVMK